MGAREHGGHSELTNWAPPGKFGRGSRAHRLSSSKIHPGQSHPTSHPNSWRRGISGRGFSEADPGNAGPGGEAPLAPTRGPELRPNRLGRAGAGRVVLRQPRFGTPARAALRAADLHTRRRQPAGAAVLPPSAALRGGGLLSRRGVPWLTPARQPGR